MKERSEKWPYSMSSSSTHDSKRGEDNRARLNVLSEIPDQWEKRVSNWYNLNREKKIRLNEVLVPDNVEEYFIYQTLVGSWPLEADTDPPYAERLENYMVKCLREAKINSSWHSPDEKYEAGVISFLRGILDQSGSQNLFMEEFVSFCRTAAYYGFFNSLSMSLIKIAAPGVPDCFQGSELMNLNLVDPDNRRPVDYEKRKMLMRKIHEASRDGRMDPFPEPLQLIAAADRLKLFLITKSLEVRKQYPRLFLDGSYIPVNITGRFSRHVVSFARRLENQWSIIAVPRFLAGLITPQQTPLGSTVWEDTAAVLPPGAPSRWQNALTGQDFTLKNNLPMGELFQLFPGALLTGGQK
jgi:(1->4)-alpha-D-glucan 1-alpha-D-glucosylmutase